MKFTLQSAFSTLLILTMVTPLTPELLVGTPSRDSRIEGEKALTLELAPSAALEVKDAHYQTDRSFISKIYSADYPFELLGLNWEEALPEGTAAQMEIRFYTEEGGWTDWEILGQDQDHPEQDKGGLWTYILTESSTAFQYRVHLSTQDTSITPKLSNVSFDYVDGGKPSLLSNLRMQAQKLIFQENQSVLSRSDWGADEDLRLARSYDVDTQDWETDLSEEEEDPDLNIVETVTTDEDGNPLLWPLEYPKKIKKIIVHHTATTDELNDPEAAIRAIYHYHAVTRGWGDIGYNFIIAPNGKVYQGRAGDDGVVAGHASGYNTGSVGIALLGNYEEKPIPGEMMQGLSALIAEKADLHSIDPDASAEFRGKTLPNIVGHRDVDATACPGQYTYSYLEDMRTLVAHALDTRRSKDNATTYRYEESGDRELFTLAPKKALGINVKIKNTGTEAWNKETYLIVNANVESDNLVNIPKDSKKRTTKMKETEVQPGQTATFNFTVSSTMNGGLAAFDMSPVFNGSTKTTHKMDLAFYVEQPVMDFDVKEEKTPENLKPGEKSLITIVLENTSNLTWNNSGENAVTLKQSGASSLMKDSTLATMLEKEVKPGTNATFQFTVKAPSTGGVEHLYFYPEMADSNALISGSGQISIQILESTEDALITDATTDLSFNPGENKRLWIEVQNTSKSTWSLTGTNAFSLSFTKPKGLSVDTPKIPFKSLLSGAISKVYFTVTAPNEPGTHTLLIRPRKGSTNLTTSAYGLKLTVKEEENFQGEETETPIRIKLTPDAGVGAPVISSKSAFALYAGEEEEMIEVFSAESRVRLTPTSERTSKSEGNFTVTSGSKKWTLEGPIRLIPEEEGILEVLTLEQRPEWNPELNDNRFRGILELRTVEDETILINELELEDYLKGIGEVSNGDPEEKIKTILVLARSYALYYLTQDEKFPGMPYHLEDDPDTSQKYLGYAYEERSPKVTQAVEETKGTVVTYKGTVVKTPYFSSSDGNKTKSAKEVWGWTNTPWLVSVLDPYCSNDSFSGHGVGLSGCGATTLAEDGWTFEEIIKYYYTGVELTSL